MLIVCMLPATAMARFMGGGSQPVQSSGAEQVARDSGSAHQRCHDGSTQIRKIRKAGIDGHVRICNELLRQMGVSPSEADHLVAKWVRVRPLHGELQFSRAYQGNKVLGYAPTSGDGADVLEVLAAMLLAFWLGGFLAFHLLIRQITLQRLTTVQQEKVQGVRKRWGYTGLTVLVLAFLYVAVSDLIT